MEMYISSRYRKTYSGYVAHRLQDELNKRERQKPYIKQCVICNEQQFNTLIEVLDEFVILTEEKREKVAPIWRLSLPVFFIVQVFLLLVFCPLKYLFTGEYRFRLGSPFYSFMRAWSKKI